MFSANHSHFNCVMSLPCCRAHNAQNVRNRLYPPWGKQEDSPSEGLGSQPALLFMTELYRSFLTSIVNKCCWCLVLFFSSENNSFNATSFSHLKKEISSSDLQQYFFKTESETAICYTTNQWKNITVTYKPLNSLCVCVTMGLNAWSNIGTHFFLPTICSYVVSSYFLHFLPR